MFAPHDKSDEMPSASSQSISKNDKPSISKDSSSEYLKHYYNPEMIKNKINVDKLDTLMKKNHQLDLIRKDTEKALSSRNFAIKKISAGLNINHSIMFR